MRHFLWILFFNVIICSCIWACSPFERTNSIDEYFTFRVCGNNIKGDNPQTDYLDKEQLQIENCKSWAKLTSLEIPISDIERLVYHWDYNQLEQLYGSTMKGNENAIKNGFARWIVKHKDVEIMTFLLLAKRYELIRQFQRSAWYYYVDEENTEAEAIIKEAKSYKQKRLSDRYTLQLMRAYITNRQYDQCVNIWLERKHVFKNDVISDMAKGYVAGAYYHINKIEKAKEIFLEIGDMSSYQLCLKKEGVKYDEWDLFLHLYQQNPNTKVAEFIRGHCDEWVDYK